MADAAPAEDRYSCDTFLEYTSLSIGPARSDGSYFVNSVSPFFSFAGLVFLPWSALTSPLSEKTGKDIFSDISGRILYSFEYFGNSCMLAVWLCLTVESCSLGSLCREL